MTEPKHTPIGAAVKRCRENAGLTQENAARLAQISRTTLSCIERDEHLPTLAKLQVIAKAMGARVELRLVRVRKRKPSAGARRR